MSHHFARSVSQRVDCASRSRLRPVVSLLGAPKGAHESGRSRQIQDRDLALEPGASVALAPEIRVGPIRLLSGGNAFSAPTVSGSSFRGLPWELNGSAVSWQAQRLVSGASSRPFRSVVGFQRSPVRPNTSVKLSTNGRPPGPSHRYGVHFLWLGPGVMPLAPAYLER